MTILVRRHGQGLLLVGVSSDTFSLHHVDLNRRETIAINLDFLLHLWVMLPVHVDHFGGALSLILVVGSGARGHARHLQLLLVGLLVCRHWHLAAAFSVP